MKNKKIDYLISAIGMIIFIGIFSSCDKGNTNNNRNDKKPSIYTMICESVSPGTSTYRCENKEAVCYNKSSFRGGLSCKFKGEK